MALARATEPVRTATLCSACAALAFGSIAVAEAEDSSGESWGGSVAVVSDYVYRGISQTHGAPALQAGAYKQLGDRWSAGIWASAVDFGYLSYATYEVNATLTRAWMLSERWAAHISYTRYLYPGDRGDYDYDEWLASLTYADRISASIAFSPNSVTAWKKDAVSYELALLQPLGEFWSLTAGVGHRDLTDAFDAGYWFWSTGIAFCWASLEVDLQHIDTDGTARRLFGADRAGSRWAAAVIWKF